MRLGSYLDWIRRFFRSSCTKYQVASIKTLFVVIRDSYDSRILTSSFNIQRSVFDIFKSSKIVRSTKMPAVGKRIEIQWK